MKIWFDMDGTIADLYAVEGWLEMLRAFDPAPYEMAKPLHHMASLARMMNKAQAMGHELCIISWCSKTSTPDYDEAVKMAKLAWLAKHLPSVNWDEIEIVPYGFPKQKAVLYASEAILFDDEERNRANWTGTAYDVDNILEILKGLL